MQLLDITRLTLTTPPVLGIPDVSDGAGGTTDTEYTLCSPWRLQSELEPVFWGDGDILMLDGSYNDPVRGYRFRATLSTQAIDINDLGILNELRRISKTFTFYPYGTSRPGWSVYIPGSMYKIARETPEMVPASIELLGTEILTTEETKAIGIIINIETHKTGTGPWGLRVAWDPVITAGRLTIAVYNADETESEIKTLPIAEGRLVWTSSMSTEPDHIKFSHDKSPWTKEVSL